MSAEERKEPEAESEQEGGQERQAKPIERRDFIKKAGQAGLSAGLAHFLLVGGQMKKAFAVNDNCPSPYTDSSDTCATGDADACDPSNLSTGDNCQGYSGDTDQCGANGTTGDVCEGSGSDTDQCIGGTTGDVCKGSGSDIDDCVATPGTMTMPPSESGDLCQTNEQIPDVCQTWGSPVTSYGDDCVVDYDICTISCGGRDI